MDYLLYRRAIYGITILYHLISVDLAQNEIFVLKFAFSVKCDIIKLTTDAKIHFQISLILVQFS